MKPDARRPLVSVPLTIPLPQVEFSINEVKRTGLQSAVSIRVLNRNASNAKRLHGFVATLKDNFGFIETANHDQEIFFHYRHALP